MHRLHLVRSTTNYTRSSSGCNTFTKIKLEELTPGAVKNQLLINPDKTKFMLIGTRQLMYSHSVDFSISFMGRTLIPVNSARDLGVIMDSHLTYDSHISYLVSSCLSKLVQINPVKKGLLRTFQCGLIYPKYIQYII